MLNYADGMIVEDFDQVVARINGKEHRGIVTKIHHRSGKITVSYIDLSDCQRTTGLPRKKTARVHLLDVDLFRRDG